jgi:hypothetical protein
MPTQLNLVHTNEILLADIAQSMRMLAKRRSLSFNTTGVVIPDDETKPPASKAADAPAPPPAASSQEPEAPAVVKLPEAKDLKPEKPRTATKPRRAKKKA